MVVEGSALMQVTACGDDSTLGEFEICLLFAYAVYTKVYMLCPIFISLEK